MLYYAIKKSQKLEFAFLSNQKSTIKRCKYIFAVPFYQQSTIRIPNSNNKNKKKYIILCNKEKPEIGICSSF